MGVRIRNDSNILFNLFAEVVSPKPAEPGWVLQKFPDEFSDEGVLRSLPMFCFPTDAPINGPVQQFSFTLTDIKGTFTFGFCRTNPDSGTCLCLLSNLPWHDLFYKLLNFISDLLRKNPPDDLLGFLRTAHKSDIRMHGDALHIIYKIQKVEFQCPIPDLRTLPSIPENRALTEFCNAFDVTSMLKIFASLLNERRIIITSKKLGRVSACVMACEIILFPLHWQHIFVTVLPKKLTEHVIAPMPYIIGVPGEFMPAVLQLDVGEVVVVDADQNTVNSPFDDVRHLPSEVVSIIKNANRNMFGDSIARSFMRSLVLLVGGYRFGLQMPPGGKISFDMEKFVRSRPSYLHDFLNRMAELQIFRQFIEERLDMLNTGDGFSDEFEKEVSLLIDHESDSSREQRILDQYKRWATKGGDFFRNVSDKVKEKTKEQKRPSKTKMGDAIKATNSGNSSPATMRRNSVSQEELDSIAQKYSQQRPVIELALKKSESSLLDLVSDTNIAVENKSLPQSPLPAPQPSFPTALASTPRTVLEPEEQSLIDWDSDDRRHPLDEFLNPQQQSESDMESSAANVRDLVKRFNATGLSSYPQPRAPSFSQHSLRPAVSMPYQNPYGYGLPRAVGPGMSLSYGGGFQPAQSATFQSAVSSPVQRPITYSGPSFGVSMSASVPSFGPHRVSSGSSLNALQQTTKPSNSTESSKWESFE